MLGQAVREHGLGLIVAAGPLVRCRMPSTTASRPSCPSGSAPRLGGLIGLPRVPGLGLQARTLSRRGGGPRGDAPALRRPRPEWAAWAQMPATTAGARRRRPPPRSRRRRSWPGTRASRGGSGKLPVVIAHAYARAGAGCCSSPPDSRRGSGFGRTSATASSTSSGARRSGSVRPHATSDDSQKRAGSRGPPRPRSPAIRSAGRADGDLPRGASRGPSACSRCNLTAGGGAVRARSRLTADPADRRPYTGKFTLKETGEYRLTYDPGGRRSPWSRAPAPGARSPPKSFEAPERQLLPGSRPPGRRHDRAARLKELYELASRSRPTLKGESTLTNSRSTGRPASGTTG